MPDQFTNARPYYDPTSPSSGDPFNIATWKRQFQALAFMDMIPLQPRAHNPADTKIMVRGRDSSAYFNPVYYGNQDQRLSFLSGDSPAFSAPVSNPRIDIVYLTGSGDIRIQQGTEGASPTLPSISVSGDRMPICAVWNRPSQTKVVNFEDSASNTGDAYIYQDLRPWLHMPKSVSSNVTFSPTTPVAPTGDAQAGPGTSSNAARSDHVHGGVHAIRKAGSSNLQGDVEMAGPDITQSGNRLTITGQTIKAWVNFNGADGSINNSFGIAGVVRNGVGDYTITIQNGIFSNAFYCVAGLAQRASSGIEAVAIKTGVTPTTTSVTIITHILNDSADDGTVVHLIFIGT